MNKRLYENYRDKLLNDESVCLENRKLFTKFLEWQSYKLKRQNGMSQPDFRSYKTLYGYVLKLKNVNQWFKNKPLKDIKRGDIQRVYDNLEDGVIVNAYGNIFADRDGYYNKIFKGKLFKMIRKDKISRDIMEFYTPKLNDQVRFIDGSNFRILVSAIRLPKHNALAWTSFDVGENIESLLMLRKRDFVRQINTLSNKPEYKVNLHKEILKRSRTPRVEITNYDETVLFLDMALKDLNDDDLVFPLGHRGALKIISRASEITGVRCMPGGQKLTCKDLRSSMACDLLSKGWPVDAVKARLGHKPSSTAIDRYATYLAIDREGNKNIFVNSQSHNTNQRQQEVDPERQALMEIKLQESENRKLKEELEKTRQDLFKLKNMIEQIVAKEQSSF